MHGGRIFNRSDGDRKKKDREAASTHHGAAERAVTTTAANTGQNVRTNNQLAATVEMV